MAGMYSKVSVVSSCMQYLSASRLINLINEGGQRERGLGTDRNAQSNAEGENSISRAASASRNRR